MQRAKGWRKIGGMEQQTNCELCSFQNPKATATAAILKDNKVLVLKRNEEPFKGSWDLPGGFLHGTEKPEAGLARELNEELSIEPVSLTFVDVFPGTCIFKEQTFPIVSFLYLADIGNQEISLNGENVEYQWVPLLELKPNDIAFDSNKAIASMLKETFTFDLARVKELVSQLDNSAAVNEHSLYRAILNGFVATKYDGQKLIGVGWIFPRQTLLRKQAVVEDMIVDEAYRGKGYGRVLLDELVKWAKSTGVEVIELTSNPKRIAANELYKKYGFQLHPTNHYLYQCKQ